MLTSMLLQVPSPVTRPPLATSVDMSIYFMSSFKLTVLPNTRLLPARPAALSGNPDPYFREFKCSATTLSNNSVSKLDSRYPHGLLHYDTRHSRHKFYDCSQTRSSSRHIADTFTLSPAHDLVTGQSVCQSVEEATLLVREQVWQYV